MKTLHKMFFMICFGSFMLEGGNLYSQDLPPLDPSSEMRKQAREEVDFWVKELTLTENQARMIERKHLEYQVKREELLLSKMQEEKKIKRLLRLEQNQNAYMRNTLTQPQYERYLLLLEQRDREKSTLE